jgi:RNA polymerase sigma factor (sigma-70 family)
MPHRPAAARQLGSLLAGGSATGLTDGQLLERFAARRAESAEASAAAESAFAALVGRHGAMVWGVCRQVAGDAHAAEDAFQATFLVLARRAGSVRVGDSLGRWLHGVARRVALRARTRVGSRAATAGAANLVGRDDDPAIEAERSDLRAAVAEELGRLAAKYREPIELCHLEGLTHEEAARRLGWPVGTVRSRLFGGRRRLRLRLARRGLAPGSAVLASALERGGRAGAAVPEALARSAVRIAAMTAAGSPGAVPGAVAGLADGVCRAMLMMKLKLAGAVAFAVGTVAAAGVVVAQGQAAGGNGRPGAAGGVIPSRSDAGPKTRPPAPAQTPPRPEKARVLKYGDGRADGKRSLGGSGHLIEFSTPSESNGAKLAAVRVHGARYGTTRPPEESFLVYILSPDRTHVLHTELAPYSLFERGSERWVEITFEPPVEAPEAFWVALDFRPHQTKGVFVSYDTSTRGKHSRVGLPGIPPVEARFGGDWMVEAVLAK